ncbi:MAG: FAD-binding oxidoreductase [Betaproteobacteria bacterium HGW-Betaproteobacteria-16]|nr:MAG: FAD-binding oxidoreductase [Betaproteobacteria bacterium HGW-Betaproteobacteria-16]
MSAHKESHHPISRSPEDLMKRLLASLGPLALITQPFDKQAYEMGARHAGGVARAVVRPASAEEMSWTIKELLAARVHFVAQGAVTGLVSGATPTQDGSQWVLSTQRLRDVLEVDVINRSATVAAGFRLSDLNKAAAEHGLTFPIDLGSDPSIGGMVATNTGGARLLRYGGVRENLLDVQGVLATPEGTQVGGARGLWKNNTGLSWKQLLCGTFGAFGVVTRATVKLHPLQKQTATALLAVESSAMAMQLLCALEADLGEFVSAFEGISGAALDAVANHPGGSVLFPHTPRYAVLIEISSAIGLESGLNLESLLIHAMEKQLNNGLILDAIVGKPEQIWRIRHSLSEAVQGLGRMIAFDLAVKRSSFALFRDRCLEVVAKQVPSALVCDFGHLGDGGVHLNMVVPQDIEAARIDELRDEIYDLTVLEYDGSFSAEHGVGPYNLKWYQRYLDDATKDWAHLLHFHFDPNAKLGNIRLD